MIDEYLFVQDLLKKYQISVSQLAAKAGWADSTVYEYIGGRKKHIPLDIWRALYDLTRDIRILDLIIGEVDSIVVPIPKNALADSSADTLKRLIEKRKKDIECETAILDILSDGKIDEKDWQAIEHYRAVHPEALKLNVQIYYTIIHAYDKALKAKK